MHIVIIKLAQLTYKNYFIIPLIIFRDILSKFEKGQGWVMELDDICP